MKKFILNADDFGMSEAFNKAVLKGYECGILKSASLCANGVAFDDAVNSVIPKCQNLSVGVHLNIIEGKSLGNFPLLTDENGNFNNGYLEIMKKSLDKEFLKQAEDEFRLQIEKIKSKTQIDHIDSHVHTHAIPNLFKIVVKLAEEYEIPYIRTQFEYPYIVANKMFNAKYPVNVLKIILLNMFTLLNRRVLKNTSLKTNDYLIGVGFTGMMDSRTIENGLKVLRGAFLAEALIHPCDYETKDNHYTEFLITQDKELKNKIEKLGIEIVNHYQQ